MRFIERRADLAPAGLSSERTLAQVAEYGEFIAGGGSMVQQKRLPFTPDEILYDHETDLSDALNVQFDRKCAFTETKLQGFGTDEILLFRPNGSTMWEDGSWPDLYWWLMADWSNMYASATVVARRRGRQFPVFDDYRPLGPNDALDDPVLLDPCRDRPEWYLRFFPDGSVAPTQIAGDTHLLGATSPEARHELNARIAHRASVSIELYQLDSWEVTESRKRTFDRLGVELADSVEAIQRLLTDLPDGEEHVGAVRQVLADQAMALAAAGRDVSPLAEPLGAELAAFGWTTSAATAEGFASTGILDLVDEVFPELRRSASLPNFAPPGPAFAAPPSAAPDSAPPPSPDPEPLPDPAPPLRTKADFFRTPRTTTPQPQIATVSIREFKAIRELDLSFVAETDPDDEPDGKAMPSASQLKATLTNEGRWIRRLRRLRDIEMSSEERDEPDSVVVLGTRAFIGENGSGKSSVLQAIALALAPDDALDKIDDLGRFVCRDAAGAPARVDVTLTNNAVFTLTIQPDGTYGHSATIGSDPIELSQASEWFLLRAYSATRTLHGRDHSIDEPARIANMFDPTEPLVNAQEWLMSLDPGPFNIVATTLNKLFDSQSGLATPDGIQDDVLRLQQVRNDATGEVIGIELDGRAYGLVSDGYRAIVNLYCDIMAAADRASTSDMRRANGIVLIDEIGAHLHPRWRMKIAGLLRREFREMQIIVSTHEPLCLRGFVEDEVVLVERDTERGVRAEVVARNPSSYRVDQLLTSEFFGLHSTLDPEESDKLDIYYQLRAKGSLTPAEEELLDETRPARQDQVLGFNYREQLTYAAIDDYLTQRAAGLTPEQAREQRRMAFDKVARIWSEFGLRLDELEQGDRRDSP